jgi:hypothetical protein
MGWFDGPGEGGRDNVKVTICGLVAIHGEASSWLGKHEFGERPDPGVDPWPRAG